jgi:hypothetical protein
MPGICSTCGLQVRTALNSHPPYVVPGRLHTKPLSGKVRMIPVFPTITYRDADEGSTGGFKAGTAGLGRRGFLIGP